MPVTKCYEAQIEYIQILDEDGVLDEQLAQDTLDDDDVLFLYEQMSFGRGLDEIAFKLQRSGRLGTYPQNKGQEAASAGTSFALRPSDWVVASYRANLALFHMGVPPENVLLNWMGDERGNRIPEGVNVTPLSVPIGTHMLHAVGIGWAAKIRQEDTVVATYFGDGATSEGDFHEAMNFASVYKTPTVFICQNNGWAISTPSSSQTGSKTFAQKALAYGIQTIRVDGNDIFATYKAMQTAVERGRTECLPTFIECQTYRFGDHTTADDARRYRDADELDQWLLKDPLIRIRKYLGRKGLWDDAKQTALDDKVEADVKATVDRAMNIEAPTKSDFFDHMFASIPPDLAKQRDTMQTHSLGLEPTPET